MLNTSVAELRREFESLIEPLALSIQASSDKQDDRLLQVIQALRQNVQIMERLDSDTAHHKKADISPAEITEISDYALKLLDEVANGFAARGMQDEVLQLHRLSIPVVIWLDRYEGLLHKLDIVVNAIASLANTLQEPEKLQALSALIERVVARVDPQIKQDLDSSNPQRPWRILNLNWGIVATRSHQGEIMEHVFERLIENIPDDAQAFFEQGMQQMQVVDYPDNVRRVMQRYAQRNADSSLLH